MKSILTFSHIDAKRYFLKEESYFNFDLPQYFVFQNLLNKISTKIDGKNLKEFYDSKFDEELLKHKQLNPRDFENVNYKFLNNKDGKFAWRPFQIIHPAIYVSLVHKITEEENWNFIVDRFKQFSNNPNICCLSVPLESENEQSDKANTVLNWWHKIEQQSIELALDYEYVIHIDIADCYGSIYTHSVVWALHTKDLAKQSRSEKTFIGNQIDWHLQDMSFGQTNGIPQGSVLMDFVAEIVLGYVDLELTERINELNINGYKIIRYRDDYRIFTNNPQNAESIVKNITEILIDLGMRINTQKTLVSENIVQDSIKPDKLYWLITEKSTSTLQKHLLLLNQLANKFTNSGSLTKGLTNFFTRIKSISETNENIKVLISIIVDITYSNPRTYPISSAILSKLLSLLKNEQERTEILKSIKTKFEKIPNTGSLQIWLQRITIKIDREIEYKETLCKKVVNKEVEIWNSEWLQPNLRKIINEEDIINEEVIEKINGIIKSEEVELFRTNYE